MDRNPNGIEIGTHWQLARDAAYPLREVVLQLRGTAGDRQVPGEPKVGYTQLYGGTGVAGVSILSL